MCAGKFQFQIDFPASSLSALLYKLVLLHVERNLSEVTEDMSLL